MASEIVVGFASNMEEHVDVENLRLTLALATTSLMVMSLLLPA
jgi:hypothetical protein